MTEPDYMSQDERYRQAKAVVEQGFGIEKWNEENNPAVFDAFKIFQQLAAENYGKAYYPLSCLLRESQDDIEGAQEHALYFAKLAFDWCIANQAILDAEIWCDLGEMYSRGHGVSIDHQESFRWTHLAANRGLPKGQSTLGSMYKGGIGVAQDYEKSLRWQRLAADQGYAVAKFLIGYLYCFGHGVSQDREEALKWWRLAADQGLAEAQEVYEDEIRKTGLPFC